MRFVNPSRPDAWDMTRQEKVSLTFLAHAVSALVEAKDDLNDRLSKIDGGTEKLNRLATDGIELLNQVRMTVPERQRTSMANTTKDYEVRLVPKFTPSATNVVVGKEEFRELVDSAQARCRDCIEDNEECRKCSLYQLLTVVLPLDTYEGTMLCPYNIAEWSN